MRIKSCIAAICCIILSTSFTNATTHTTKTLAETRIIVEGYFNDGNVIVTIDYNPGRQKVTGITVYSPSAGVAYTVLGYDNDTRISYSAGTLTCTGFVVSYLIPGQPSPSYTSWTGDLTM